jgi:hypothetical protein
MASKLNLPGMQDLLDGSSNWLTSDYRVRLLMTNTTADTENNIATLSAYTTIDKFNGAGFSDNLALTGEAVSIDAPNNRVFLDADDCAFGTLGNGTRQIQGIEVFDYNGADSSSVPFVFVEFSAPFNPTGAQVTIQWDVNGLVQFA